MTTRNLIFTLILSALAVGCDSRAVPTAPVAPVAPLAPVWAGTFVSSNWSFSPFDITARLQRTGNIVEGTWFEERWLDFGGTIKGTIDGTAFIGTVTINDCKAEVKGSLTDTTASWTSPALNDGCAAYTLGSLASPVDIKFQLSR